MKVSIIIPAYNEEKRIGKTLAFYSSFFNKLKKDKILDYEIIVIINGTTDSTEDIVKSFLKKEKNISYLNLRQGSKGLAVLAGFKNAIKRKNDLIGFVDADMATPPESFYDLIKNINNYDAIIASRYLPGAIINPKPTLQRIIVSRIFNFLIKSILFLKFKDTQCGAKLFKKKPLEKIINKLTLSNWAFDVDMLYTLNKNGFIIKEMPTRWSDMEYSKINFWKASPWMFLSILRLRILNSPFKKLVNLYGFFLRLARKITEDK